MSCPLSGACTAAWEILHVPPLFPGEGLLSIYSSYNPQLSLLSYCHLGWGYWTNNSFCISLSSSPIHNVTTKLEFCTRPNWSMWGCYRGDDTSGPDLISPDLLGLDGTAVSVGWSIAPIWPGAPPGVRCTNYRSSPGHLHQGNPPQPRANTLKYARTGPCNFKIMKWHCTSLYQPVGRGGQTSHVVVCWFNFFTYSCYSYYLCNRKSKNPYSYDCQSYFLIAATK